jgi:antitoxin component YwqK of YwqJK toxin-antitoxin module
MIGYKVAKNGGDTRVVITLDIPEDAFTNMERSTIRVKDTAKYRTNKAIVVKIEDQKGNEYTSAKSFVHKDKSLTYTLGETLIVEDYDLNIEKVCSSGIHFFLNKRVAELYNLDHLENGILEKWHDNGQKHQECTYKDGKPHGLYQVWQENGQKYIECTVKHGKYDGLYQVWHNNGQKTTECTYKDGKYDGLYQVWHNNGEKSEECTYKYGKLDGLYQKWFNDGEKYVEHTYKDGKQVK